MFLMHEGSHIPVVDPTAAAVSARLPQPRMSRAPLPQPMRALPRHL